MQKVYLVEDKEKDILGVFAKREDAISSIQKSFLLAGEIMVTKEPRHVDSFSSTIVEFTEDKFFYVTPRELHQEVIQLR